MFEKKSYIKQIGKEKFRVYSEKGRNMGTYKTRAGAKKRLREIEYFKHQNSADDNHIFPRGGKGAVPEFFRKNLDYGERDEVLRKKLSKLKAAKSALQDFGFKKEAASIKNSIKTLLLNAFLAIGLVGGAGYAASELGGSEKLNEIISDFSLEESPNLSELKKEFQLGTTTDSILLELYPDIKIENKKDIIIEFLKEYNPNLSFGEDGLQLKQSELFGLTKRAEVAYPDLKKIMAKFARRMDNGYFVDQVGKVGEMDLSDVASEGMKLDEGFRKSIYNDDLDLVWPKDKEAGKGHWMIGYGHKLKEEELKTGIIKLKNRKKIKWTDGISEEEARWIKADDVIENSLLAAGINENTDISRSMYDALTRLSYNFGSGNLTKFVANIKDDSGKLSSELFAKEISGWTGVKEEKKKKGVVIDRIGSLLAARGVLLPANPEHVTGDTISPNSEMKYPTKDMIFKYLEFFTKKEIENISEKEARSVLNALSKAEPPPSTPSEAYDIMAKALN